MKVFVIAALVAAATAEPYYGGYGYGGYGHGGYAGHYGGGSSYVGRTIWGLGKRSADAEPEAEAEAVAAPEAAPEAEPHYGYGYGLGYYGPGIAGHPGLATSFVARSPQGLRGKRSAEPYYGYYGQYSWPSYSAPGFTSTVWGARGKRSAEPSAEPHGYGFYGYHPYAYGLYHPYAFRHHVAAIAAPEGTGVAGHPGGATSFVSRSPQGLGKRSAEEPAEDDKVYGAGHNSYVGQTVWGFPKVKRSAEEVEAVAEEAPAAAAHVAVAHPYFGYYGHQLQWPSIRAPGFSSQCFGCRGKRSAEAEPGYGYYGYPGYYRGYYGYPYGLGVAGHPTGTSYSHRSPQGLGK